MAETINICFHGVGTPARELEPGEDAYWIGVDTFHRVLDEVMTWPSVRLSFDAPWTSDRITPEGRERLRLSGFAPPHIAPSPVGGTDALEELAVLSVAECPYCGSQNTTLENPFGPTLCRAIYHCADCRQPFEQFKRI